MSVSHLFFQFVCSPLLSFVELLLLCGSCSRKQNFELLRAYDTFKVPLAEFVLTKDILQSFSDAVTSKPISRLNLKGATDGRLTLR